MNHLPRILDMRQHVIAWFATLQAPELGFGVHADSAYHREHGPAGMYLPGTYNAVNCLSLLGAYADLAPEKADSIATFLNRHQRPNGAYRIPEMTQADIYYPDFEYINLHITNYSLGALASLGRKPALPLAFVERYATPEKLSAWLAARQMSEPWGEGNYIVNVASFFAWELDHGAERFRPLLEQLLDWHTTHQDAASGYWNDPSTRDLTSAMAGAAHNLHLYYYLNRPVPRFEKIIGHCLGILEGVSSSCLDIDVVDILANLHGYGYRQPDIEAYLDRKLAALLDFQNPDGGFADVCDGTRLFDGWERYQEPQGLSNTFSTWFRCATVGMICHVLYPETRSDWHFRHTLGMGYFHPQTPSVLPAVSQPEQPSAPGVAPVISSAPAAFGADAAQALTRLRAKLAGLDPSRLASASAVYQFEIGGQAGGSLSVEISEGRVLAEPGENPQARVTLSVSPETLNKLLDGKLNATVAYMTKKLKIRGDIALAMKLEALLRSIYYPHL
jgi:hypothetical protein